MGVKTILRASRLTATPAMTDDNQLSFKLPSVSRKKVTAAFVIGLTAPSYGIHGTPEPDKIGKTESHGCIRLTNWDALDLAGMVHKGTVVKFVDGDSAAGSQAAK